MNMKHIQNEKTQEEIINRLSGQHGHECRKMVEENRRLRDQMDSLQLQINQLQEQNNNKDAWLDEVLNRTDMLKEDLIRDSEVFTKVCLQLEVRRFQADTLKNFLNQNDISIPNEV